MVPFVLVLLVCVSTEVLSLSLPNVSRSTENRLNMCRLSSPGP